jgi:hypothetical protein
MGGFVLDTGKGKRRKGRGKGEMERGNGTRDAGKGKRKKVHGEGGKRADCRWKRATSPAALVAGFVGGTVSTRAEVCRFCFGFRGAAGFE